MIEGMEIYARGNISPLIMLFFNAARSKSNFQMSEIKHEAKMSAFHLETPAQVTQAHCMCHIGKYREHMR